eukprot:1952471-Rhodomonas_salina.3
MSVSRHAILQTFHNGSQENGYLRAVAFADENRPEETSHELSDLRTQRRSARGHHLQRVPEPMEKIVLDLEEGSPQLSAEPGRKIQG